MATLWDKKYPDKKVLRKEITCMLEAFVDVLLEEIPESAIEMIYFKGSAQKNWESPLDYVPEISDVDIHLLFTDDSSTEKYLGSTSKALHILSKVEKRYLLKTEKPLHVPRPQLVILNRLLREKDFIPTPKSVVSVLYGKDYPKPDYSDQERIRAIDCNRLIAEEEFLSEFPLKIIDKPSKYLWESLRAIVWHVSPLGSRVLSIKGISYEEVWTMNRTKIVAFLQELGEHQLAQDYTQFYSSAWDYFLSGYSDTDAGRKSLLAGVNALSKAVEIAKLRISRSADS